MRDLLPTRSVGGETRRKPDRDLSYNRLADWSLDHPDLEIVAGRAARIVRRYTAYDRLRLFRITETIEPVNCRAEEIFDSEGLQNNSSDSTLSRTRHPFGVDLERWIGQLARGRMVGGSVHKFPRSERQILAARGLRALLAMPIRSRDESIWGFVCFEATTRANVDEDSLALLHLLVSAIRKAVLRQNDAAVSPAAEWSRSAAGVAIKSPGKGIGPHPESPIAFSGSADGNVDLDRALVRISRILMTAAPDLEDVLRTIGETIGAHSGYLVRVNQISPEKIVSWIEASQGDRADGSIWSEEILLGISNSGFYDLAETAARPGSERSVVPVLSPDDALLGFIVYEFSDRASRRLVDSMRLLSVLGDLLAAHFERMEARESLSESEQRWRSLIDAHPDAFFFVQENLIVYANASAVRTFGARSQSDLTGRHFHDFLSASEYTTFEKRIEEAHEGRCSELWEHDVIRLDGEHRIVESCCIGVTYRGKPSVQITLKDITDRKRFEEGYERFLAAIDEGIARIDVRRPIDSDVSPEVQIEHILQHGRLAEANSAMRAIFGMDDSAIHSEIKKLDSGFLDIISKAVNNGYFLRGEDVKLHGTEGNKFLLVNATASIIRNKIESVWITCVDRTTKVELEKTMIKALEDQQQRIGRDLHDGVGQLLTGARILSQSLVEKMSGSAEADSSIAKKISRFTEQASEQISTIYRGLTPVRLFNQDISDTLRELAMSIDGLPGVSASFSSECDLPPQDNETRLHIYRIAQEALNNALKHSGARHLYISITEASGHYSVRIEDDGCGLPSDSQKKGHIGLSSMEYRAHAIGAVLSIASREEGGTIVECKLPKDAA